MYTTCMRNVVMAEMSIGITRRAKDALQLAGKEAERLGQLAVGPEHILLGLLREGTGLASGVLTQLGVGLPELRAATENAIVPGEPAPAEGRQPDWAARLTTDAREALVSAQGEAERLRHNYIGQEHVLLALLRQGGGVARVLARFGVTAERVEAQVLFLLGPGRSEVAREEIKRYNLALPESLFREVVQLANREDTTVLEVIRRSIKLGLFVAKVQQTPGAKLIIREGATEREIVLL